MLNEDTAYLLGNFAGDGWFEKRGISIGTKNPSRAETLGNLMGLVFNKTPKIKKRIYKDGHIQFIVSIYSVAIERNFRNLLGNPVKDKSKNFKVPTFRSKKLLRAFVRGMFEAEAYFYLWYQKPRVSFEIFNEEASKTIFRIIREDKIACSLSKIKIGGYRIDITGSKNTSRFCSLYNVTFCRE